MIASRLDMIASELRSMLPRYQENLQDSLARRWAEFGPGHGAYPVTCRACGRAFYALRPSRRYCGHQCKTPVDTARAKRQRPPRRYRTTCRTCGQLFVVNRKGTVYCSNACRQKNHRALQKSKAVNAALLETVTAGAEVAA